MAGSPLTTPALARSPSEARSPSTRGKGFELFGRSLASCAEGICAGHSTKRIRLRAARAVCTRLLQSADVMRDSDVPLEQLLGAERNLLAIEAWLSGGSREAVASASTVKILRALGGPSPSEDEDCFFKTFFPPVDGERLACMIACSAMSNSFALPGRLHLSSARICFECFLASADTRLSVMWEDVLSARLTGFESSHGDSSTKAKQLAHPVRIVFKRSVSFNGEDASQIEFRFTSLESLGHLDKCAAYFTGSGLLGMHPEELANGSKVATRSDDDSMRTIVDKHIRQIAVWQLQRRTTIWSSDWRAPFLPHDGQKRCSWTQIRNEDFVRHGCLPNGSSKSCDSPPILEVDFMGKRRPCKWKVVSDEDGIGTDGWQYAVDFYTSAQSWTPKPAKFSHVRRRLWHPDFEHHAEPAAQIQRLKTTLMVEKGLRKSSANATQLFSANVGIVPMDTLGKQLQADNWMEPGGLMFEYFQTLSKAKDVDIGTWTSGGQVQGSVRSVHMRVPVPPAPMCPPETRVSSTWHMVCSPSKVVLESVIMSLDVPYGECFSIVTVDTFAVDESSGQTYMVRVLALEWLKTTWLKGMIETNVNKEIKETGEKWATLIAEWAERATSTA